MTTEGVAAEEVRTPRESGRGDAVRRAGRGWLAITGAKFYFIVVGYGIQLALPRLWSKETFGLYSTAMQAVSILNNVLIVATVQSVSKFVSEAPGRAEGTLRQALAIQAMLGVLLGGSLWLAAPAFAGRLLLDASLQPLLRVASVVVFAYALYAAMVGALNGLQRFGGQAALDATFSTFRAAGIVGAAALGYGALGSLTGFAAAAVAITLVAAAVVGLGAPPGERWPLRRWFGFVAPLGVYHLFLNLVMLSDLLVLKRTVTELAAEQLPRLLHLSGASSAEPAGASAARIGSQYAGLYRAAQMFAFVPYQLMLSMTFVVFPAVSRATAAGDREGARRAVSGAMRFSFLVLLAVAAPLAGAADGVMRLAYPESYLEAAPALGILVFGLVAFTLFVLSATILNGSGRPWLAAAIAAIGLLVGVGAGRSMLLLVGLGARALPAVALGSSLGMSLAMGLAAFAVRRGLGAWVPWSTVWRALVAAAVGFLVAHWVPHTSRLTALLSLVSGGVGYVLALGVLRELGAEEWRLLRRVLGRS